MQSGIITSMTSSRSLDMNRMGLTIGAPLAGSRGERPGNWVEYLTKHPGLKRLLQSERGGRKSELWREALQVPEKDWSLFWDRLAALEAAPEFSPDFVDVWTVLNGDWEKRRTNEQGFLLSQLTMHGVAKTFNAALGDGYDSI